VTLPDPEQALALLADRECRIVLAAMITSCDRAVRAHTYGHDSGGTSHLTARGAANATGLGDATAATAMRRLGAAGLALSLPDGGGWRLDEQALAQRATALVKDDGGHRRKED
jgi:hypothetical protein